MMSEDRQLGRAKNAILDFFENRLTIPKIYMDADWGGHHVDVLAINRDGAGDVYAVLVYSANLPETEEFNPVIEAEAALELWVGRVAEISANYKFVASVSESGQGAFWGVADIVRDKLLAADGIGRIGLLRVDVSDEDEPVRVKIKPERFRAKIAKLATDYVEQHEADWEIRA